MIQLSENQQTAFQFIIEHLSGTQPVLLEGSAGTGKTTLTKHICNYYNRQNKTPVCAIAPTHKSKKVVRNVLNQGALLPVAAFTVASALNKVREHSFVATKKYSGGNSQKLSSYGLFIIDEISMINDEDLQKLLAFAAKFGKKVLLIGDSNQIPCPSAKYDFEESYMQKKDNYAFTNPYIKKVCLTQIVRQAEGSPILALACFIRDHLLTDMPFPYIIHTTQYPNCIPYSQAYETFKAHYTPTNTNSCRVIAYTNQSVKAHNQEIRALCGYEEDYVVGELLTGYVNVGWPELIIENGEDYLITKIARTSSHSVGSFRGLSGRLLDLVVADTKQRVQSQFFIQYNDPANYAFMSALIELAEKVNKPGSTKQDFRNYSVLKNRVIFMEDIYKMDGVIYTEHSFKESHPLLFVNVNELISPQSFEPIESKLAHKINTTYAHIIEARIADRHKTLGDSENLADRFMMIEKDMYYGYSITAHKSQGSTYDAVVVDEMDFQKISDKWNYKYDLMEMRTKEKNQLRYVAYTRAKQHLYILYNFAKEGGPNDEGEEDEEEMK
jgi:hypothetical protein